MKNPNRAMWVLFCLLSLTAAAYSQAQVMIEAEGQDSSGNSIFKVLNAEEFRGRPITPESARNKIEAQIQAQANDPQIAFMSDGLRRGDCEVELSDLGTKYGYVYYYSAIRVVCRSPTISLEADQVHDGYFTYRVKNAGVYNGRPVYPESAAKMVEGLFRAQKGRDPRISAVADGLIHGDCEIRFSDLCTKYGYVYLYSDILVACRREIAPMKSPQKLPSSSQAILQMNEKLRNPMGGIWDR